MQGLAEFSSVKYRRQDWRGTCRKPLPAPLCFGFSPSQMELAEEGTPVPSGPPGTCDPGWALRSFPPGPHVSQPPLRPPGPYLESGELSSPDSDGFPEGRCRGPVSRRSSTSDISPRLGARGNTPRAPTRAGQRQGDKEGWEAPHPRLPAQLGEGLSFQLGRETQGGLTWEGSLLTWEGGRLT